MIKAQLQVALRMLEVDTYCQLLTLVEYFTIYCNLLGFLLPYFQ